MLCYPLYSVLNALRNPTVDYLSLDLGPRREEFQVLKSIPWNSVEITLISGTYMQINTCVRASAFDFDINLILISVVMPVNFLESSRLTKFMIHQGYSKSYEFHDSKMTTKEALFVKTERKQWIKATKKSNLAAKSIRIDTHLHKL